MKKYIAILDDGHDFFEFEYFSNSKNNSKQNKKDCMDRYKKIHGPNRASHIDIINTFLVGY